MSNLLPAARKSSANRARDWCSHQREALPGGQAPSSSGAQTNTGTTGPPRRQAACNAGLSARRRSCRSQTMARAAPGLAVWRGLAPQRELLGSERPGTKSRESDGAVNARAASAGNPMHGSESMESHCRVKERDCRAFAPGARARHQRRAPVLGRSKFCLAPRDGDFQAPAPCGRCCARGRAGAPRSGSLLQATRPRGALYSSSSCPRFFLYSSSSLGLFYPFQARWLRLGIGRRTRGCRLACRKISLLSGGADSHTGRYESCRCGPPRARTGCLHCGHRRGLQPGDGGAIGLHLAGGEVAVPTGPPECRDAGAVVRAVAAGEDPAAGLVAGARHRR